MILFLLGMPGSGKTSIGKELAKVLNWTFYDTDEIIENNSGRKISEIFSKDGENHFRELERKVLREINGDSVIIATGGGTPIFFNNLEYMKKIGNTVFIDIPVNELISRLENSTDRPLITDDPAASLEKLYKKRLPIYQQADVVFKGSDEEIISSILKWIRN